MKRTSIKTLQSPSHPVRGASDNLCKRLAEEHPAQFALWLFGVRGKVKVEKTEMSREPIRADSVIFSRGEMEALHIEFQTSMKSDVPVPLRMLDYYVGFKRKNPDRRVRQSLVVLKPTIEAIPDRYEDERTSHSYDVVRLWEQDPAELLDHEGLLPLATLCRAQSGEKLLSEVAARIRRIESREQRRETLNWSRVLAGLRYDKNLITRILKESDMLEESVIYQDILQKGEQRGLQEGAQQEARKVALRLLELRFGKLSRTAQRHIEHLDLKQLEGLCEALLDFKTKDDLTRWLKRHAPDRRSSS
jgi:predicted transposase YdaD